MVPNIFPKYYNQPQVKAEIKVADIRKYDHKLNQQYEEEKADRIAQIIRENLEEEFKFQFYKFLFDLFLLCRRRLDEFGNFYPG